VVRQLRDGHLRSEEHPGQQRGDESDKPFEPHGGNGTVFMNTYAMQAAWHMKKRGTS